MVAMDHRTLLPLCTGTQRFQTVQAGTDPAGRWGRRMKNKGWVFVFPPFLVLNLVGFHFWPIYTFAILIAGMVVRLTIIDYFVRRRRRNE